jgi:hypothetical protein
MVAHHEPFYACAERHDDAGDIARAGVETGIAFDKNSDTPITLYKVKLA